MYDDLIATLRALARFDHADITVGDEAADAIEHLLAGGCARDQHTTQWCAEAMALQQEVDRLRDPSPEMIAAGANVWRAVVASGLSEALLRDGFRTAARDIYEAMVEAAAPHPSGSGR